MWTLKEVFENSTTIALSVGGGLAVYVVSGDKSTALIASMIVAGSVVIYQRK